MSEPAEGVQDTADFSAMSTEDLSSYLANDGAVPKGPEPEPTPEPEPEPKAEDTPAEPEPPKGPTLEEIQAELDRVKKQTQDKELFIQRRNQEIGQLRKQLAEFQTPPELPNILDDPVNAVNTIINQRDTLLNQQRLDNQAIVASVVPDLNQYLETITGLALADGFSERDVALFRQDPYVYSTPQVLINYARRAELIQQTAELKAQIAEKEKTITELQKKPEELLRKVEKAAKEAPGVTGKAGEPATRIEVTSPAQFSRMTDAELAQWRKENP